MIGETVGNYRILSLLGEGGMGAVYLAEHPGIGRKAAVKVLHPGLAQNKEVVMRFFNEARAANAIRHPGIVEIFDFGTLPTGATYIIMELLLGESLGARMGSRRFFPPAEAVELIAQTASVLGAAHQAGIVHRDLKPDNLFIVRDQHAPARDLIKVLDFGIAKLTAAASGGGSVQTRTGTLMGTPLYMSPEQCRGTKDVDHRSDVYSLGVILYEMLCGVPPFVSEGHGELIHLHIAAPPPPPRSHNPAVPPVLEAIVLKTLAKDPAQRFPTMEDLERALRELPPRTLVSAPLGVGRTSAFGNTRHLAPPPTTFSTAVGAVDDVQTQLRGSRRTGPMIAAVLVVAAAAGAWALYGRPRETPPLAPTTTTTELPPAAVPPPQAEPTQVREIPAAAAPQAPAPVSIAIVTTPAGARVVRERDGADIGVTPFKESWPAGEGIEKLRLELPGYRATQVMVPRDRGVQLGFYLQADAKPSHHTKKAHGAASEAGGSRVPPPAPLPDPPKPARAEPVPL